MQSGHCFHGAVLATAVGTRSLAGDLSEASAERTERSTSDCEARVGDAGALAEERHRSLDAPSHQVAVGRLAVDGPESARKMRG